MDLSHTVSNFHPRMWGRDGAVAASARGATMLAAVSLPQDLRGSRLVAQLRVHLAHQQADATAPRHYEQHQTGPVSN